MIDPTGIVRVEAGIFTEEMVTCEVHLEEATGSYAANSLRAGYLLSDWWRRGLEYVTVHGSEELRGAAQPRGTQA